VKYSVAHVWRNVCKPGHKPGALRRRLHDAEHARVVDRLPVRRGEYERRVRGLRRLAPLPQCLRQQRRNRDVPPTVLRLRWPERAAIQPTPNPNTATAEIEVHPPERERLRNTQPRLSEELDERPPLRGRLLDQPTKLLHRQRLHALAVLVSFRLRRRLPDPQPGGRVRVRLPSSTAVANSAFTGARASRTEFGASPFAATSEAYRFTSSGRMSRSACAATISVPTRARTRA